MSSQFNKLAPISSLRKFSLGGRHVIREDRVDKLFADSALNKEFKAADEYGRNLMLAEHALERMAAPIRKARQERLQKAVAERERLAKFVSTAGVEIAAMGVAATRFVDLRQKMVATGHRSAEDGRELTRAVDEIMRSIEKIDVSLGAAGAKGVGELAKKSPFVELTPLDLDRPILRFATESTADEWTAIFAEQRAKVRRAVLGIVSKQAGADDETDQTNEEVEAVIAGLSLDLAAGVVLKLSHILGSAALDAAARTYAQVALGGASDPNIGNAPGAEELGADVFADLTKDALSWATAQADELVEGIKATTRDGVREAIAEGLADGTSRAEMLALISNLSVFSDARAALIASTETAAANGAGVVMSLERAVEAGLHLMKAWRTVPEPGGPCPVCIGNEEAGALGVDAPFPSGDQSPPSHVHCKCRIAPLLRIEPAKAAASWATAAYSSRKLH